MLQNVYNKQQSKRLITDLDMQISPTKSKAIWFNADYTIYQPVLHVGNKTIDFDPYVKNLGIYMDGADTIRGETTKYSQNVSR